MLTEVSERSDDGFARREEEQTSSEMRLDWLAERWVIVSPSRRERPQDYIERPPQVTDDSVCPFCAGHEEDTPAPVATYKTKASKSWAVRVVPNKYPAVTSSRIPSQTRSDIKGNHNKTTVDLFERREFSGGHEVVVESPKHLRSLSDLDRQTTTLVFLAYRDRLSYWLNAQQQAYAVAFKNVGIDAGASLFHTHSQIIATDFVPTEVERAAQRMQEYFEIESCCLFCRMVHDELEHRVRVIEETPDFVAFCPFASQLPGLITLLPKKHTSQFENSADHQIEQLSWLAHRSIRRLERCFPQAAYNFVLHTAPSKHQKSSAFHWRLEIFPRLVKVAGFEWGSDCYINPLPPEQAAADFRAAGV